MKVTEDIENRHKDKIYNMIENKIFARMYKNLQSGKS